MSGAALDHFTRCSALELAPKGIRVNGVNPGVIQTPFGDRAGMTREEYESFLQYVASVNLVGRVGQPEEVGRLIAFLASNECAGYMTGNSILIDGGRSLKTV